MAKGNRPGWYDWTLKRWNEAIVDLVFSKRPDTSSEIVRIDATHRLLVSAANGVPENADAIRQSFLNSFPKTRSELSELFDASLQTRKWHPQDLDLPFFAQLYLTILVASADEETFTIGNFRNRLQVLLGVDLSVGHVLGDLPELWNRAARWTRDTRRENVRRLVLPSPEHEKIIGHSKRLAFPGFQDQTKLAKLLAEHGLDASAPENQILSIIARRRQSFSKRFGEEFDSFLRLIQRGDRTNAMRSPFWGAIIEISWDARTNKARQKAAEFELELDPNDPYTASLMLVARGQGLLAKPWTCKKLSFPAGEMEYEVICSTFPKDPLLPLLEMPSGQKLVVGTPIFDWVARGWIGFCRDELERWVASQDLSKSDGLWLLVRDDRWCRVARALAAAGRQPDYELEGVLSDKWTLAGPFRNNPGLREVLQNAFDDRDSFAARLSSARIRLVKAIRLPEGILLVPPCLPTISMEGAAKIDWSVKRVEDTAQRWLLQDSSRPNLFSFNQEDVMKLPPTGEIEFRAYDSDDEELDRTSLFFVSGCASCDLKRPGDLASFLIDGDHGQLVSANEADHDVEASAHTRTGKEVLPISNADHERVTTTSLTIDEIPADWHACLEILTGNFVRRSCIPVGEFFDIVAQIWNLGPRATWMRIGDLVENGFVEHLYHRRWRGSVFAARLPQAVIADSSGPIRVRISGLMPGSRLRKLFRAVTTRDGDFRLIASGDRKMLGAIEVIVEHEQIASTVLAECGIPTSTVPKDFMVQSWHEIFSTLPDLPPRTPPEIWSANKGMFFPADGAERTDLLLERWHLERAQILYRLTCRGALWSTSSRLWALLAYKALSGEPIGSISSDGSLCLEPHLSLPPSFARRILCHGAGVCLRGRDGRRVYPGSSRWDTAVVLARWTANAASETKSTALSRYHEALRKARLSVARNGRVRA